MPRIASLLAVCSCAAVAPAPAPASVTVPALAMAPSEPPLPEAVTLTGEPVLALRSEANDGMSRPLVAFTSKGALLWVRRGDDDVDSVLKIDKQGTVVWKRALAAHLRPEAVAVAAGEGVVLGGDQLHADGSGWRFVTRLGPDGEPLWEKQLEVLGDVRALAITSDDGVIVEGQFHGSVDLGGGPIGSTPGARLADYVLKLDRDGRHVWSKSFAPGILAIAATSDGGVMLAGNYGSNVVDHGTGPIKGPGVVAKLGADGTAAWARRFDVGLRQVLLDAHGATTLLAFAPHSGTVSLGGDPIAGAGLVRLDASGQHQSSALFGSHATAIGFDASGHLVTLAHVHGNGVTLGGRTLQAASPGYQLVKLSPDLEHRWHRVIACDGEARAAVSPDGRSAVTCVDPIGQGPRHANTLDVFAP